MVGTPSSVMGKALESDSGLSGVHVPRTVLEPDTAPRMRISVKSDEASDPVNVTVDASFELTPVGNMGGFGKPLNTTPPACADTSETNVHSKIAVLRRGLKMGVFIAIFAVDEAVAFVSEGENNRQKLNSKKEKSDDQRRRDERHDPQM